MALFAPGDFVGHYMIRAVLEVNPRFETFLAVGTSGTVVLKAIAPDRHHYADIEDDITRQFQYLSHPSLQVEGAVSYLELFRDQGKLIIAMQYAEGELLRDRMIDEGWPLVARVQFLQRLGTIIDDLHSIGIVHRDISDKNVIISPDGSPILFDYDLSHLGRASSDEDISLVSGNYWYKSPEQWSGTPQDASVDIFAFALLTIWTLTKCSPLWQSSELEKITRLVRAQTWSEGFKTILKKSLSPHPSDRPIQCSSITCHL